MALRRNRVVRGIRRLPAAAVTIGLSFFPSQALAHRGFGPAELGLPIGMTIALAIACYWLVMWWPESKKKRLGRVDAKSEDTG